MSLLESLRIALRGLASNKMRTMLTMLGIIIGVAVVILVVAIGQGATKSVTDAVNSLGTNLLSVFPGSPHVRLTAAVKSATSATSAAASGSSNHLKLEDATIIADRFSKTVDAVCPQVRTNVQIALGNKQSTSNLTGTTANYGYVNNAEVTRGRLFNDIEYEGRSMVCVIGSTVADKLTGDPGTDLTGQTIQVNRLNMLVVGMLAPKGSGAWGQDQDDIILCPLTTAMQRIMNRDHIDFMGIRCTSPAMMPLAQEQIANFLRNRHHLQPPFPDNDDFNIRSQTELMARQRTVTDTMTSLLSIVAVISLIVGGIGIMNIMLVSVTERTREIGIRKAIGATPRDILMQFLIESAIISLLGGIIGIGIGIGGTYLLAAYGGWNTIINLAAVGVALGVSGAIGLFFGIYPASKAAALHPIEALRFD